MRRLILLQYIYTHDVYADDITSPSSRNSSIQSRFALTVKDYYFILSLSSFFVRAGRFHNPYMTMSNNIAKVSSCLVVVAAVL
jgi:hypothetical protein